MELCLITPMNHLERLATLSKTHLVLTQWVLEHPRYAQFYRERSLAGDYIILDNGAYENSVSKTVEEICRAGEIVPPSEIVLPDCMRDAEETKKRSEESYPILAKVFGYKMKFMAVVHGKTVGEWNNCLLFHSHNIPHDTIGVPRVYADDFGGWYGAIQLIVDTQLGMHSVDPQIHLLGAPENMEHLARIAKRYPNVIRSADTAKPVNYALAGRKVPTKWDEMQFWPDNFGPKRPKDFITRMMTPAEILLAEENYHCMDSLLRASEFVIGIHNAVAELFGE